MSLGHPRKEAARGKLGVDTLLPAHTALAPSRQCLLHKDVLCSKRVTAGFRKYGSDSDHLQLTRDVSSENGSPTVQTVHIPATRGTAGGGCFLGTLGLKRRVIKLLLAAFLLH